MKKEQGQWGFFFLPLNVSRRQGILKKPCVQSAGNGRT